MNRCPRCGESVAPSYVVCHACGYLPAGGDELTLQPATERSAPATIPSDVLQDVEAGKVHIKEPIVIEPDYFTEYILPWLLIALGIGPNIYLSLLLVGPLGPLAVGLDIALLLLVQIPVTAGIMMVIGIVFGINFGLLWTGIVKLAAVSLFVRGLAAISITLFISGFPAGGIAFGLIALAAQFWLMKSLFDLEFFELLVCYAAFGISLGMLQYLFFLIIQTANPAA